MELGWFKAMRDHVIRHIARTHHECVEKHVLTLFRQQCGDAGKFEVRPGIALPDESEARVATPSHGSGASVVT